MFLLSCNMAGTLSHWYFIKSEFIKISKYKLVYFELAYMHNHKEHNTCSKTMKQDGAPTWLVELSARHFLNDITFYLLLIYFFFFSFFLRQALQMLIMFKKQSIKVHDGQKQCYERQYVPINQRLRFYLILNCFVLHCILTALWLMAPGIYLAKIQVFRPP